MNFKLKKTIRILLYSIIVFYILLYFYGLFINKKQIIPKQLNPIYLNFIKEAQKRGVFLEHRPIIIEFTKELEKNDLYHEYANCTIFPTPKILISQEKWNELSMIKKEIVLYHELTHCLWFMGHNEKKYHLMNSSIENNLVNLYSLYKTNILNDNFNLNSYYYRGYEMLFELFANPFQLLMIFIIVIGLILIIVQKRFYSKL